MSQLRIFGPESSRSSFIQFGAVLNNVEYQFELQWNNRHSFWMLGVVDARRQPVLSGLRVVAGNDMLGPYNDMPRLPPGRLIAHDTQNKFEDPGRDDWIERHLLIYEEPVDVPDQAFVRIEPIIVPE